MPDARQAGAAESGAPPRLLRVLGLREITAIVMGGIIGSAIFIVPAQITASVGAESRAFAVWIAAGILSLFGALTFAELSAMMPEAGGQYIFLREAYGPLAGFLCGWMFFLATQTGAIAALAVGFSQYLAGLVPLGHWQQKAIAAVVIAGLTAINYRGVKTGGWLQSVLTGATVGAMVAMVVLAFTLASPAPPAASASLASGRGDFYSSMGLAMVAALWAYEGWNAGTFVAGEAARPERNMPLALILGTGGVMALYLAMNAVYYHVLPLQAIAGSPRVAQDAAARFLGDFGSKLVAAVIIMTIFGCANSSILSAARVYFAMAEDGLFFRSCARVHPRFRTPHVALVAGGIWSVVLVMLGRYDQLFTYVIFAAWCFYALTAAAVIVLRRKRPQAVRPYRVWGYPWVPVIFVLTAVVFIVTTLAASPAESGWGSALMVLGIPVYYFWRWPSGGAAGRAGGKSG